MASGLQRMCSWLQLSKGSSSDDHRRHTNLSSEKFIVKSVNHFRIHNERDVLLRFQNKTSFLRPLLDEIEHPASSPAIVLQYLDDDILHASNSQRLTHSEVKYVARCVLQALSVLHREGFVHTGWSSIITENI